MKIIDSSTNMVIVTLNVGDSPRALEYNPSNEYIYVANFNSGDVSIIDSSTNDVVDTVDVGVDPVSLEYNPSNEYIYVANQGSSDVSVIGLEPGPPNPNDEIRESGNNINIQVQKNTGSNALAQDGSGNMYSDESIFQRQFTEQESNVVS